MPTDRRNTEQCYRDGVAFGQAQGAKWEGDAETRDAVLEAFDDLLEWDAIFSLLPLRVRSELEGVRAGFVDTVVLTEPPKRGKKAAAEEGDAG